MIQDQVCDSCKDASLTDPSNCDSCIKLHIAYAESMGKPCPVEIYNVSCTYYASDTSMIELPLYKTWKDIEEWHVKWSVFHYKLKGEEDWREHALNGAWEISDSKRPVSVTIETEDFEKEVASA